MSLNKEYIRKLDCLLEYIPKRMYAAVAQFEYTGFFTYERLTLENAKNRAREPLLAGRSWGKKWEYGWFFADITVPSECRGEKVVFSAELGETLVYLDDQIVGSFDREHTHITLCECANGGEKFQIAMEVYAGHSGKQTSLDIPNNRVLLPEIHTTEFHENIDQRIIKEGNIGIFREEVFQCWMDIQTLYDLRDQLDDNSLRKAMIDKALMAVCNTINVESVYSVFQEEIRKARALLQPVLDCKNGSTAPVMYAVGNSHLDLEWKWTVEETRRKTARTLGNQLRMLERYPDYKYIQSQAWILDTVKQEYPELYAQVKQAVADGKIVPEGGMWVQADTNIPSGESLIRQIVLGKKFVRDEFGMDNQVLWLPDVFGVSGVMPQIMKGCGIKYFMNAKIIWNYNDADAFPHTNFMWQGIDGTRILTHVTEDYAAETKPSKIFARWNQCTDKADVPAKLFPYGYGDGGGGATPIHLEYLRREQDLEGMPKVRLASPNDFFEYVERECRVDNRYVGELYYPAHRGTYTAQAKTKKCNRWAEFAMRDAEIWSTLLKPESSKSKLDELWKEVLFNQFHDVIPGSSIAEVHERAEKSYEKVICEAKNIAIEAGTTILTTQEDCITLFNSLSWEITTQVLLPDGYSGLKSMDGEIVPVQQTEQGTMAQVWLPALGYRSYMLLPGKKEKLQQGTERTLENNLLRVRFNEYGELESVYDKQTQVEYLSGPSNVFRMYQDMPTFSDAWDIDSFYEQTEVTLERNATVRPGYKGALFSSLQIEKKLNNSRIVQTVVLWHNSRRLDFETEIDYQECHKLLKVDFNTNIHTEELVSEIQFGHIKRPNHKSRPYDADRFEVWQHKWSALAENNRGVAVLNDSKYGISADDGRISLTLLKSSAAPALSADQGKNTFTYSLMPFCHSLCESGVLQAAYELNTPVMMLRGAAQQSSFLHISADNVIVDTVKQAEDGSGDIILRLYEAMNQYTSCRLGFNRKIQKAYKTDMLEENSQELELTDNAVCLNLRGFEIVTLRLHLSDN